jgi:hypothetical protein
MLLYDSKSDAGCGFESRVLRLAKYLSVWGLLFWHLAKLAKNSLFGRSFLFLFGRVLFLSSRT